MRLRWFRNLNPTIQILLLIGLILIFLVFYIPLSKYIKSAINSALLPPLKLSSGILSNARHFLRFQDLIKENKELSAEIDKLTAQLLQLQEAALENQRLRQLLALPERETYTASIALLIGKDSSNWTNIVIINKGAIKDIKKDMPVILGPNLVGKIIEVGPFTSKVSLITDFNSKVPAKILRTREDGLVFGTRQRGQNVCKMKYIQEVEIGDKIISSGLGKMYPKGILIGEVVAVEEEKNRLYKVAQIKPAVNFSKLEEVMVITAQ